MSEQTDEHEKEQALAAFEHAAEELRFFKGQQWSVANYALLAQAATVTVPGLLEHVADPPVESVARLVGVLVALAVLRYGWNVLSWLDRSIRKERDRMYEARRQLPTLRAIHTPHELSQSDRDSVAPILRAAIVLGAVAAVAINLAHLWPIAIRLAALWLPK